MKTLAQIKFVLASLLLLAGASGAEAHGDRGDHGHQRSCESVVISRTRTGPANYHATYAAITRTQVTIQDFYLRTNDGQVVKVPTSPQVINLQDLTGFGKGLQINTTGIAFPNGATTIDVVEIETNLVDPGSARLISTGAADCALGAPKKLNFYTAAPVTIAQDQYIVKVPFSTLASIQIDDIVSVIQNKSHVDSRRSCSCEASGDPETKVVRECRLVNRRQAIGSVVRRADEF